MTIQDLIKQFDEYFGKLIMIITSAEQLKKGTWRNNKDVHKFLRTNVKIMMLKNSAYQYGFMEGYKSGRESYKTQINLQPFTPSK